MLKRFTIPNIISMSKNLLNQQKSLPLYLSILNRINAFWPWTRPNFSLFVWLTWFTILFSFFWFQFDNWICFLPLAVVSYMITITLIRAICGWKLVKRRQNLFMEKNVIHRQIKQNLITYLRGEKFFNTFEFGDFSPQQLNLQARGIGVGNGFKLSFEFMHSLSLSQNINLDLDHFIQAIKIYVSNQLSKYISNIVYPEDIYIFGISGEYRHPIMYHD
jgi:hypothetical protein